MGQPQDRPFKFVAPVLFSGDFGGLPFTALPRAPSTLELAEYLAEKSPADIAQFFDDLFNALQARSPDGVLVMLLRPIATAIAEKAMQENSPGEDLISFLFDMIQQDTDTMRYRGGAS